MAMGVRYGVIQSAEVLAPITGGWVSSNTVAGGSSHSLASQGIGTAAANRFVVVALTAHSGGSVPSITGCTIGGVSATLLHTAVSAGNTTRTSWYGLTVAAGTTATVAWTLSSSDARASCDVFAYYGLSSTTPTNVYSFTAGTTNPQTIAVVINAGGGMAAVACSSQNNNPTSSWKNLTIRSDYSPGGGNRQSAADTLSTPGYTGNISHTWSAAVSTSQLVTALAFR